MTDQDVRDFLEHMAAEEPVQFLDAGPLVRRGHRRAARTVVVGALGVAAAFAVVFAGAPRLLKETPTMPVDPPAENSVDLGIFEPVAGRIVYGDRRGIWAVDPGAPDPATTIQLTAEGGSPLGWSSDGTRLLIERARGLSVLHADGSETHVTEEPIIAQGASISPDGSRVVFARGTRTLAGGCCDWALYATDAEGGPSETLMRARGIVEDPAFSPDGMQIAYVDLWECDLSVWVMDADGSNRRPIVSAESLAGTAGCAGSALGLSWSPDGERIALALEGGTYTLAPDGSDLTKVITDGANPYWSPDGSQIAYGVPGRDGFSIADADGSNVLTLSVGAAGPWHPGTPEGTVGTPATPPPSSSLRPPAAPGFSTFSSIHHELTIDYPAGWKVRPATEPWTQGAVTFDASNVDVIFDPSLGDDVYLALVSEPLGGEAGPDWVDSAVPASTGICADATGGNGGGFTLDDAEGWIGNCGNSSMGGSYVAVATDTRGYLIYLHHTRERALDKTYDEDFFEDLLATVDLDTGATPEELSS
jgi:hypothetical protein